MYHYIEDKEFLRNMRSFSGEIMQSLCHHLKVDHGIGAGFTLVGSGGRNLVTQNAREPVDLDYNLEILKYGDVRSERDLKERVQKAFNRALKEQGLEDCDDSTSVLTSNHISFRRGNRTAFSIDVAIVKRNPRGRYCRLIHHKTGFVQTDWYTWAETRWSDDVWEKAEQLNDWRKWELVRAEYLKLKNRYLTMGMSKEHPSFVCYAEAVSNVYNAEKLRRKMGLLTLGIHL